MSALFHAVVLAGDRGPDDPVARHAGAACKALVPVAGQPMLLRVLDALAASTAVSRVTLVGPTREQLAACRPLARRIAAGELAWLSPAPSPSQSALAGLASVPAGTPVLLTTADHALLQAAWVDAFCAAVQATGKDAVVGLARHAAVQAVFPKSRRTALRFRDGAYCGCNLFAFLSPAGRRAPEFWRRIEQQRKKPHRLAAALGPGTLLAYLCGWLTLEAGLGRLSRRVGARLGAVLLDDPRAAVDVDSVADFELVERLLAGTG
ncbi:MAG TPA: nucleotidyltransferase family protein [Immundisolibacter sp.]|nr:nucleotidyltransferase family protein [Immundisolibacter sp.]